ncbi:MAG: phosphatidate cytidylyltransferase [Proteobacteria bacterium]|nr:phosphatidate cytidylyltransferase [Pseudomonadota bacterium]
MNEGQPRKSDLGVRTLSAIVMLAVAGGAVWLGGVVWSVFATLVGIAVYWEWVGLARQFSKSPAGLAVWVIFGVAYIGLAVRLLTSLEWWPQVLSFVLPVIAVDIGAYFAGRTIGGPKIAPRISPSKTWAGLGGGMLGASLVMGLILWLERGSLVCDDNAWHCVSNLGLVAEAAVYGTLIAAIAQAGDFFESWMKRKAGVKDSAALIPGHGGLFDRVDGLIAVLFVIAIVRLFLGNL